MIPEWRQLLSRLIPLRDGVRLSCDIRFPEGEGPWPVALWRTPYNKALNYRDARVVRWISQGYVFVGQDCRGRHESEGVMDPQLQEINDGADTIAWLREQPWCDGNIVMTGESYCGWTQLAAASAHPEGLRAILPQVMCTDGRESTANFDGFTGMTRIWWPLVNTNRSQMADPVGDWDAFLSLLPVRKLDEALGFETVPAYKEALDEQTFQQRRKEAAVLERLEETGAGILLGVGWFDLFSAGSMRDAMVLIKSAKAAGRDNVRVVAGPWGHALCQNTTMGEWSFGAQSLIDLAGLQNAFARHHIDGSPLPPELEQPLYYFLMGANEWLSADSWPPSSVEETVLYLDAVTGANSLHGDGRLVADGAEGSDSDTYLYDPLHPTPAIGGSSLLLHAPAGPMDQRPAERRDDVLCYTSDVLATDLSVVGIPHVDLYVASSAVDTDFFARLCVVTPDGRSVCLCDGAVRLDRREHNPGDDQPQLIRIELASTAYRFAAGEKIRLEVASSCFPRFVRNLNSPKEPVDECAGDAVVAHQTVYHTGTHPSRIMLPVLS